MSCTKNFLNFQWDHHSWRRRVTATTTVPTRETTMWGGVAETTYVRCQAEYVCQECGTTREEGNCLCDTAVADHCPVRLAWIAKTNSEHSGEREMRSEVRFQP